MSWRDTFDLTPQQYHGGLDKLWKALGLTDVQDEDVFTLSARVIARERDLAAAVKEAYSTIAHEATMGNEGYMGQIMNAITKVRELVELTPDTGCLTPRQVKEGTAKVCEALGIDDCDPSLMFTMAASAIDYSKHLERIIRVQPGHGALSKILLYPCPKCNRFTIDEWYANGTVQHREMSTVEVASIQEARDLYRVFFPLRESYYVSHTDSYTSDEADDNLIVTGSNCTCKECRT